MQQQFDHDAIRAFLRQQFPALAPGERIELRAFSSGTGGQRLRDFFAAPDEAAAWIVNKVPVTLEVYCGVNPRLGRDGTKEGVAQVLWLWCDLDYKHFGSPEEAEAMLDGFDLPPTTIIRSGGGVQVYWRLARPVDPRIDGARTEHALRRLYVRLGNLDAVQDLSRILRVPGTWNNKREYGNPQAVRQVYHDPSAAYTLEDFERCLPILPIRDRAQPTRATAATDSDKPSEAEVAKMLSCIPPTLPYSEYLAIWMGVASLYPGPEGLALIDAWSSAARAANGQSSSPRTEPHKHAQFRRSGYGIGTVIHYAKQGGYQPPAPPVPRMIHRQRESPWRRDLGEIRDPPVDELPDLFQRAYDFLGGLTEPFPRDWTTGLVAAFASILFPHIRFENLPLNLWFLGVAGSGTGKNDLSDNLYDAWKRVQGADFGTYTSGTPEGMYAALEGQGRSLLCYHREYGDYLAGLKREHMSGAKGVLCNLYDGRGVEHRLSKVTVSALDPHVVVVGTTTQRAVAEHMALGDLQTGYVSRFLVCTPDVRNVYVGARPTAEQREALTRALEDRVRELAGVRYAMWDTGLGQQPGAYVELARALGVGTGEIRRFEDELGRTEVPQGRLLARVKKLAAIFEACERAPQVRGNVLYVRESNLLLAILLVRRYAAQAQALYELVTASQDQRLMQAVEIELKKGRPLTRHELLRRTHSTIKELVPVLNFLSEEDRLLIETGGRAERYYLKGA